MGKKKADKLPLQGLNKAMRDRELFCSIDKERYKAAIK